MQNFKPPYAATVILFILALCSCEKKTSLVSVQKSDTITTIIANDTITVIMDTSTNSYQRFGLTLDNFIGVNGFHEDNTSNMKAVGLLRAYCDWDWFQGENPFDSLIFEGSRSGWYFDEAFKKIQDSGLSIDMCFQNAITNLQGTGNFNPNNKPIDAPGLSTTNPNSYKAISSALFQIAARYGETKVANNLLNVAINQKISGLGLIQYIEVWNEPDKTWDGPDAQFSPEEYAAMLSACYDSIKRADPYMKVVMAGLATLSIDYIKRMYTWFQTNRVDKKFAADVVNMHIYAFNNNSSQGPAETPEDAKFKEQTQALVTYVKNSIPNTQVWISEFGWDTNSGSVLCPKQIKGLTINEIQGRWITRAYLGFAAAGVDQAQLFILADPSQNYIGTQFGTCGLTDRTLNFARKTSWYYVAALKSVLKNMEYLGEQIQNYNTNIIIYKFKDISSKKGVYAIWSNSSSNNIISNYTLHISQNSKTAQEIDLTDGSSTGTVTQLSINNHSLNIQVSEKPTFIVVDNIL